MSDPVELDPGVTSTTSHPLFGWARPGRTLAIVTVCALFSWLLLAVFVRWLFFTN